MSTIEKIRELAEYYDMELLLIEEIELYPELIPIIEKIYSDREEEMC